MSDSRSGPSKLSRPSWKTFLIWMAVSLPLVLAFRSSVVESFKIPSGSMIPTLLVGDHVLVNKTAYRWRVPFTEYAENPSVLRLKEGPRRGDVVVFRYPRDLTVFYVKRVIGVSGDWIAIKDRALWINDQAVTARALSGDEIRSVQSRLAGPETEIKDFQLIEEDLEGRKHLILHDQNQFLAERYGPVAVPPGNVFVMGDNRDFSDDSRFFGFVPLDLIEGRAFFVWLQFSLGWDPFEFFFNLRRWGEKV